MAITQEDIFVGSYYRTQFGEVREVTGIVGSNVYYQEGEMDGVWFGFIAPMGLEQKREARQR